MKKISIIIPVYNSSKSIVYCLDSIYKQNNKGIEIIIVNDGSVDESDEMIKNYIVNHPKMDFIYIKTDNFGVSHARNEAMKKCKTEYVMFLDSDDLLQLGTIDFILDNIDDNDIFVFDYLPIYSYDYNHKSNNSYSINRINSDDFLPGIFDKFKGYLWNKVYKTDIIKNNHIVFDEDITICEDLLFNTIYGLFIKKGIYSNFIGYLYYQNENSSYNKKNNLRWFTILESYKKIENLLDCHEIKESIKIFEIYDRTYISCEAVARNKNNTVKFKDINTAKEYIKKNSKRIFNSNRITMKKKIKLLLFIFFPKVVYNYKLRKVKIWK